MSVEQERQRVLDEAERRHDVDLERHAQLVERVVAECGQRRGAERAGVVDEEVEPAQVGRGACQVVTVRRRR